MEGKVHVGVGPVQMAFSGTVVMDRRDDVAHRAKLSAKGTEQRGKARRPRRWSLRLEPAVAGHHRAHQVRHHDKAAAQLSRVSCRSLEAPRDPVRHACLGQKLQNQKLGRGRRR